MAGYDVGIIGGGIIGTSAAAFLAEAGLSVLLLERAELAAGASGRNSGAIQHPFDPRLATLHRTTLDLYRELAPLGLDFELPSDPAGLLLLSRDADAARIAASSVGADAPELSPEVLSPEVVTALEPAVASDVWACRLRTGYPVAPAAAAQAFAERARRAGAVLMTGVGDAHVEVRQERAVGVRAADHELTPCGAVLVAAGPWTPALIEGWRSTPPIRSVWGVVVSVDLPGRPTHVLEELGIDKPGSPPEEMFSLVSAGPDTSVGSTFLPLQPDPESRAPAVLERARGFVPSLAVATALDVRACARPVAFDGRPLIGAVPDAIGLYVCAGHGPWGISTGPGSARLVADLILGRGTVDDAFSPARRQVSATP